MWKMLSNELVAKIRVMPPTLKIAEQERAKRASRVEQAVATVRLEGLEPGAEALAIYQRYVEGEISLKQVGSEIDALNDRDYGPVRLPRNGRS
jgi:hypothetical protein